MVQDMDGKEGEPSGEFDRSGTNYSQQTKFKIKISKVILSSIKE